MIIKIDPFDTLFFRDGKPFTMGDENWANGVFPPNPSVIYGAIRTAYFSNNIKDFEKANTPEDPTRNLRIKGIYFSNKDNKIYLPAPHDLVRKKEGKSISVLSMIDLKNIACSCTTQYVLMSPEKVENIEEELIDSDSLKKYLENSIEPISSTIEMSTMVLSEPKIGIGVNNITGTNEEGQLYRFEMKRLRNLSLVIDFEGIELQRKGIMKLGGEGKAVYYNEYSNNIASSVNIPAENRFKIYFSTPAIFEKGWLPKWINEKTLEGEYEGFRLKMLTMSAEKPISIGGFDMKAHKPKPMYRAIPAGSVYYFEVIEGDIKNIFATFNQRAISDLYSEQGFGISYIGRICNA